ncbi:MAG TPA: CPBP family intramembrane glutamic endopeptidase, partial [Candidatus Limnocylindria bacterium]|nr:CPBP family intramembrane glutamic endopeptidase [Candidatus Limnocylindria bacterium]
AFLAILLLGGPLQEEFGWRGYALPRLVARFRPPAATLVLAVVWTGWHLPFWFMHGSGMAGTPLPVYFVYMLGLTAVMTWLYVRTAGSVLAAILMHATANWISNVLPTHTAETVASNAYLFQAVGYLLIGALLLWRTSHASARSPRGAHAVGSSWRIAD